MNLLAPVKVWEARRAVKAARRRADAEILASRLPSPRLAWRIEELVGEQNRVDLGRALTNIVHTADEGVLPSASPVDRSAVRVCRPQLLDLASRLHDLDSPVSARGVLLVEGMLADGSGPLYGRADPRLLRAALDDVRAELDGVVAR
ncbi:MAG: hypothetical protein ACJ76I_03180 [Gaiellaceae bacterium]